MDFQEFKTDLQNHFSKIIKDKEKLFIVDCDKDELWNLYLDSFLPGTNEIFRERREYDCSCCRQFIRSFGNVVVIENNKMISIWDFKTKDKSFQVVIDSLSYFIKSKKISDVFITKESKFGTDFNHEAMADGRIQTWHHFYINLPKVFVDKSSKSVGDLTGQFRDIRNVFKRSLDEISIESVQTVLELISQKSLYKGDEWKHVLDSFLLLQTEYLNIPEDEKDNYCWDKSLKVGGVIGKIKNHSIGVLLSDISSDKDLNEAVKRYEKIVAPTNYKRPNAIFTQKMLEQAKQKLEELGLLDSLKRRHSTINDITVNNIIFANKDTHKKLAGDIFDEMKKDVPMKLQKLDKIEEVSIDHFIESILPKVSNIELFLENKHSPNLFSLIAPEVKDSTSLFKWNNNFSWAYNGNITDSMKERVKAAGGKVDGVLRFSIQWNDGESDLNDYDAHCIEPDGNHICFPNKGRRHPSTGMLDVDIIHPRDNQVAVENITWTDINKMQKGRYKLFVHNYTDRGGRSGFSAEIEYDGQIYSYEYKKKLRYDEKVIVAEIEFDKNTGIKFIKSLDSTMATKTIWNLKTNQFHPVSILMFSPNYWDDQKGIGHKHYFFILKDCINEIQPNGFFNEFLKEDLAPHKRVFEALGNKMKVEKTDDQLSGLGFSSTQRNSLICKVDGAFTRTLKITF